MMVDVFGERNEHALTSPRTNHTAGRVAGIMLSARTTAPILICRRLATTSMLG